MNQNLQSINYATVRDAGDEQHIECRFKDGQKYAAVIVDSDCDDLCHEICDFINTATGYSRSEIKIIVSQGNPDSTFYTAIGPNGFLIQGEIMANSFTSGLAIALNHCTSMEEIGLVMYEHGLKIRLNNTSSSF